MGKTFGWNLQEKIFKSAKESYLILLYVPLNALNYRQLAWKNRLSCMTVQNENVFTASTNHGQVQCISRKESWLCNEGLPLSRVWELYIIEVEPSILERIY